MAAAECCKQQMAFQSEQLMVRMNNDYKSACDVMRGMMLSTAQTLDRTFLNDHKDIYYES